MSPSLYNSRSGLAFACPITTQVKGYPFEVVLPAGLQVSGCILADQLRSLDWRRRKARFIEKAPPALLADLAGRLAPLLGN
ncbi:MAG: type II toxin-antitoxin system PemK/MazF family toxin [Candidatus Solibacter usitatus]|nr:type II toxin-antitoxin system PemK/MazF family toxin [Candidatus Solibacter usitatus]